MKRKTKGNTVPLAVVALHTQQKPFVGVVSALRVDWIFFICDLPDASGDERDISEKCKGPVPAPERDLILLFLPNPLIPLPPL